MHKTPKSTKIFNYKCLATFSRVGENLKQKRTHTKHIKTIYCWINSWFFLGVGFNYFRHNLLKVFLFFFCILNAKYARISCIAQCLDPHSNYWIERQTKTKKRISIEYILPKKGQSCCFCTKQNNKPFFLLSETIYTIHD